MQCSNCGATLKATAKICINCGASVSNDKRSSLGDSTATTSGSCSSENNDGPTIGGTESAPLSQSDAIGSIESFPENGGTLQPSSARERQYDALDVPISAAASADLYIKNRTPTSADRAESTENTRLPSVEVNGIPLFAPAGVVVAMFRRAMLIKMYLLVFVAVGCVVAIAIVVTMLGKKEQTNVPSQYDPVKESPARPLDASTPALQLASPPVNVPVVEPPAPTPVAAAAVETSVLKPAVAPRPKPKPSAPVQSAPKQPDPITAQTGTATRPMTQEPQTMPVKQFSCADLSFALMLICKLEGTEVIRKCAPDMKSWNNNLPGCQRGNAGAEKY
jgi:hypothetical protein